MLNIDSPELAAIVTAALSNRTKEDFKVVIPEIDKKTIKAMLGKLRPLKSSGGDLHLWETKAKDYFTSSYTWDGTLGKKVSVKEFVDASLTFVTCGYYGFFKPSLAEVLSQAPKGIETRANAFDLVYFDGMGCVMASGSHQWAVAVFYNVDL